jgi:hypothetical protein
LFAVLTFFGFVAWLFSCVLGLYALLSGDVVYANPTLPPVLSVLSTLAWLACWIGAGLYVARITWRLGFGVEMLEFTRDALTVRHQVLCFVTKQVFPQHEVWNLRTRPKDKLHTWKGRQLDNGQQTLEFDYGRGTVRVGVGLSEAAAKTVLALVLEKFPQYAPREPATRYAWQPQRP